MLGANLQNVDRKTFKNVAKKVFYGNYNFKTWKPVGPSTPTHKPQYGLIQARLTSGKTYAYFKARFTDHQCEVRVDLKELLSLMNKKDLTKRIREAKNQILSSLCIMEGNCPCIKAQKKEVLDENDDQKESFTCSYAHWFGEIVVKNMLELVQYKIKVLLDPRNKHYLHPFVAQNHAMDGMNED